MIAERSEQPDDLFTLRLAQFAAAGAAAKWWADKLRDKSCVGNNGGRDVQNVMARALSIRLREGANITPEMCDKFEDLLYKRICRIFSGEESASNRWSFEVWEDRKGFDYGGADIHFDIDYHPHGVLLDCLLEAGVEKWCAESYALPLKTRMFISARRVVVFAGYGVGPVEIRGPVWGSTEAEYRECARIRHECAWPLYTAWRDDLVARFPAAWREVADAEGWYETERWQGPVLPDKHTPRVNNG